MSVQPSKKLTKTEFVKEFYPYAKRAEKQTKVPTILILSQAAIESGWNSSSPGWMMFGIKDTDGINGNEQLITTTEYLKNPNAKFPVIISKVFLPVKNLYKYVVKTWFRKYETAEQSFIDHGNFFLKNKRYKNAIACGDNWRCWAVEIAAAGYATSTKYAETLLQVGTSIEKVIKDLKLDA